MSDWSGLIHMERTALRRMDRKRAQLLREREAAGMSDTQDAQVQAVIAAIDNEFGGLEDFDDDEMERMARVAIDALAATPAPEAVPLEDVLSPWEPLEVSLMPLYSGEIGAHGCIDTWIAKVRRFSEIEQDMQTLEGWGDTIDAALRAAVRATRGEASNEQA